MVGRLPEWSRLIDGDFRLPPVWKQASRQTHEAAADAFERRL